MTLEKANTGLGLLTEGFKLNTEQRGLIIRVGWVAFVSVHIAWICGFLGFMGLNSPYVRASDIKELIIAQRETFQSKVDELADQIVLEERRRSRDLNWTDLDELKLSQMKRRLQQESDRLQRMKLAEKGKGEDG